MNRTAFPAGLLCSVLTLLLCLGAWADPVDADKEVDKQHLQQIWTAIMDYKKAHGQLPDYLSSLVPEFLPDKSVLLSPLEARKRKDDKDPKFPTSYSYEFSARPFGDGGRTFGELKADQMKEFGPVVPILRCFAHGRVMNMAYSGDYYETDLFWEKSPEAKELIKKLGVGAGFDDGEFADVQVVDDQTGQGVAGVEVQLTRRQYHFLGLPDRTIKTDADGKVRVPLGPAQPPSRRLTVTLLKAGFYAPPETWLEGGLPTQKTFRLLPASTVGGVVGDHDGTPLAGALVAVYAVAPGVLGADSPPVRLVEKCPTDETGHWHCASVPKDFSILRLRVEHATAWRTEFHCGPGEETGAIDRDALLAQKADFRLEPAALVSGVVLAADGSPVAGEEVTITSHAAAVGSDGGTRPPVAVRPPMRLKTDAAGRFSVPWQDPAELTVSIAPKNMAVAMRTVTAAPGMEPIQLRAAAPRRIAGVVHDSDGKPLAGVRVTFIGWAEASVEQQVATTDAKGEFAWAAAPSDQIGLVFARDGFLPSTEWVPADKKDAVQVELRGQQ